MLCVHMCVCVCACVQAHVNVCTCMRVSKGLRLTWHLFLNCSPLYWLRLGASLKPELIILTCLVSIRRETPGSFQAAAISTWFSQGFWRAYSFCLLGKHFLYWTISMAQPIINVFRENNNNKNPKMLKSMFPLLPRSSCVGPAHTGLSLQCHTLGKMAFTRHVPIPLTHSWSSSSWAFL